MANSKDIHGNRVLVGSMVRVLKIKQSVFEHLSDEEVERVRSMEGDVFEVYEIDEWDGAWIQKWWYPTEDSAFSHSLGLSAEEMEVVSSERAN